MSEFPEPPDEHASLDLARRLSAGDPRAWDELYGRHRDRLLFAIRVRMGSELAAFVESEDILQSVARDAFTRLSSFEYRGPGSLQRYLWTLIENKLRDRAASARVRGRGGAQQLDTQMLEDASLRGAPRYAEPHAYERLERALAGLPDDLREIVLLRKLDGLASRDVADKLGLSDDAVRKATSRALALLALRMSDDGGTARR